MGFDEIDGEGRRSLIENNIMRHVVSVKEKAIAKIRSEDIVRNYTGRDLEALSILCYAAEKGKFDEYAGKLETHYEKSLQFVLPINRRGSNDPGTVRVEKFIMKCYQELDILIPL
jgi:hypothetical protein